MQDILSSLYVTVSLLGTLVGQQITTPVAYAEAPVVVKVDTLFEKIALCESGNNPLAKNPKSTASGRFQFLKSSWNYYGKQLWGDKLAEKNVFDYEDNTELAAYVYKKNGTKDWLASKECWSSTKVE